MAPRQKSPPPPPPARVFHTIDEIDRAITKLRRRIQDVERLGAEHTDHGDAAVDNVEHAIVDTIREEFGEGSAHYQRHMYFQIDDGPRYMMGMHESREHFHARGQHQFEQKIPGAITRLEGLIQQLEEKRADMAPPEAPSDATVDPLVGLPTRGECEREFIGHTTQADVPMCFVLFDIDRFKHVNDDHGGHQTGDQALVAIADVARACIKGKGSAFRFGGDEFVVLLPNHSLEEGVAVAERFRRAVAASPRTARQLTLTVSVGVASWPADGVDFTSVYGAADKALYDAKNRGRNLVRFYGEPEPKRDGPVREPERRQPEPGELSGDERRTIREEYFRTRVARCPKDQALLEIEDITGMGQDTRSLMVSCPLCGLSEELD